MFINIGGPIRIQTENRDLGNPGDIHFTISPKLVRMGRFELPVSSPPD
jgi:hypothetical protein